MIAAALLFACVWQEATLQDEPAVAAQPAAPPPGAIPLRPRIEPLDDPAELTPACAAGDGRACFNLGVLGVEAAPPAPAGAILDWFVKACDGGVARGCFNAGRMSTAAQDTRRVELLGRACDGDYTPGCLPAGRAALAAGRPGDANRWFEAGCEAGEALACTDLGVSYYTPRDVARDPVEALRLFKKGCGGGDNAGCVNAARILYTGDGVAADQRRGLQYLLTACQRGAEVACTRIETLKREAEEPGESATE